MLFEEKAQVRVNMPLGCGHYLMELYAPRTAAEIAPGQFVHMGISTDPSHILRRPFSVYSAYPESGVIHILYQVVGEGTDIMSRWGEGDVTSMIAPIGYGWDVPEGIERALLVGGGVGAAPLFMLCVALLNRGVQTDVVLGARTADALVCLKRYEWLSHPALRVSCSTDDGTFGRAGFCTSLVDDALDESEVSGQRYDYAAICGPEPLMHAASRSVLAHGVPCQVSLERRMACGIGACLSCVVDTVEGKRRACVDGPVFDAEDIIW